MESDTDPEMPGKSPLCAARVRLFGSHKPFIQ